MENLLCSKGKFWVKLSQGKVGISAEFFWVQLAKIGLKPLVDYWGWLSSLVAIAAPEVTDSKVVCVAEADLFTLRVAIDLWIQSVRCYFCLQFGLLAFSDKFIP